MTKAAKLLERISSWPNEDIEKLEEAARQIEAWRNGEYHATNEELHAIDEAIAELDRGEVASEAQVEAAFAKFRNA
jgi:transcription elongation GreA/GreB family factor